MTTTLTVFRSALTTRLAEGLSTNNHHDVAMNGVTMKIGRNNFYAGTALAIVGAVGIALLGASTGTVAPFALGLIVAIRGAKKVYDVASIISAFLNEKPVKA